MTVGLLLLTGGQSTRMGALKHALRHPEGRTWGGHLIHVFATVFPDAPTLVLGDPLPDRPDLVPLHDPREGPGVALRTWAKATVPQVDRWWIVACDQVRWTPERLTEWAAVSAQEDSSVGHWVMALHNGHLQPLGGWFPSSLRPALAASTARSLMALAHALPHLALPREGVEWMDVDTPDERREFEAEP